MLRLNVLCVRLTGGVSRPEDYAAGFVVVPLEHNPIIVSTAASVLARLRRYDSFVTKVELHYDLVRPLTDADAQGIANVHSWYGIIRVRLAPDLRTMDVEYDASRLTEKDVEAVLHRFSIPIQRKWSV